MHSRKKALIITYYWPPSGGSGVQRWLKFVKYLAEFNVDPVIYTVKNPSYAIIDTSLLSEVPKNTEVLRKTIVEPNSIGFFLGMRKKESAGFLDSNPTFFGKIRRYLRANFFIPDARKFWIHPSVKFLSKYIQENPIDVVISTGPPHSTHLIGLRLKKKFNIPWVSDFRDPWTEIDYFHQLPLTEKAIEKHRQLEEAVLKESDRVIVVGDTMKQNFLKHTHAIEVIPNGYDTDQKKCTHALDKKFSITHVGLMNADRNPVTLWKVLKEICNTNSNFKNDLRIRLIGDVAAVIVQDLTHFDHSIVELIPYLSHEEVTRYQMISQVLLLSINKVQGAKGIVTGKIFEYLQAKRPILAIGPEDGDASIILKKTNSGAIFDFYEREKLKTYILFLYKKYKAHSLVSESRNIGQYHRKKSTQKLVSVLSKLS